MGSGATAFWYRSGGCDMLRAGGQGAGPALDPSSGLGPGCESLQGPQSWGLGSVTHSAAHGPAWQVPGSPVPTSQPQNDASPLLLFYSEV